MTFCAAPFVHIVQNPNGEYRTCCMYEKPFKGKYKDIKEAFDSEENSKIRNRMLSGEKLPECHKCDIDENHRGKAIPSYRHYFDKYAHYKEKPVFKTLEISVSNRCNFKCVTCNERFSNQFGPTIDNEIPDEEYFKDIEELKILGGEPFLDKRNIELLKKVPKNIKLMIVTNCSIFPNEETLNLLSQFKHFNLNISIDGINDVAEFVRYGTKWSKFERNFFKWKEYWKKRKESCYFTPHIVVHSYNAPFIQETIDWLDIPLIDMSWDFLNQPEWLNISYLPDKIKEYIIDRNESLKPPLEKYIWSNDHNEHHFNILKRDIFQKDFPKSMDDYVNMLI